MSHLKPTALTALEDTFHKYAINLGLYRRVVSLVTNFVLLRTQLEIKDWFHFYLDVWSAVTFKFSPNNMSENYLKTNVDLFFDDNPPTEYMKRCLEYKTPALARQHECTAMSENTILHLKQFKSRLLNYVRASVVSVQNKHYSEIQDDATIAFTLVDCILSLPEEYDKQCSVLHVRCDKVCKQLFDRLKHLLDERLQLGLLVSEKVEYKVKTTVYQGTMLDRILEGNKGDELLYRLLPHLTRYSDANFQLLQLEGLMKPLDYTRIHVDEEVDDDANDSEDEVDNGTSSKCWTRQRRPRPFRIAPFCKLQRSMVYFGWTEVKAMYNELAQQENKALKTLMEEEHATQKNKRKRGEKAPPKPTIPFVSPFFMQAPEQLDVFKCLFDLKHIKGVKDLKKWRLCCFRTDGVKCVLTFVSGASDAKAYHGATGLLRPGYRYIKQPTDKIDIRTETRGLYRINQNRNDILSMTTEELGHINLAMEDPGFNKVLQHGVIKATCDATPDAVASALCERDAMWYITQEELMLQSGRLKSRKREETRRNINTSYAVALDAFSLSLIHI